MYFDDEGLLCEPCLSCDKAYVEDIWHEWCCDEKECQYKAKNEEQDDVDDWRDRLDELEREEYYESKYRK